MAPTAILPEELLKLLGDRMGETEETPRRSTGETHEFDHVGPFLDIKLEPAAGEQLQRALGDQADELDEWISRGQNLARQAPLGDNPVANAVARDYADLASSGERSFVGVLTRYREVLRQAQEAIDEAMRTYRQADEHAAEELRKLR